MPSGFSEISGVNVNKADIKSAYQKDGKDYVELKNGVTINIIRAFSSNGEAGYIKIDKENKTQIGNILSGGIKGTNAADDIELTNVRMLGDIDLKDGDDKLLVKDSFVRTMQGGNGNDTVVFDNTRLIESVDAEHVTFKNNSSAHGTVKANDALFADGSGAHNKVDAKKVVYKNQFPK